MLNNFHIINGNLFDTKADVIAHQVNCQGVMGSGVAKTVRLLYPKAYDEYKKLCSFSRDTNEDLLGTTQIVRCTNGIQEKYIANMFAQDKYGKMARFTNYEAFYNCLERLRDATVMNCSIAFPYNIGCDRGGANWNIILAMIKEVLKNREVYIYELEG